MRYATDESERDDSDEDSSDGNETDRGYNSERVSHVNETRHNTERNQVMGEFRRFPSCNNRHKGAVCWRCNKCPRCDSTEHPAERCYNICKACNLVHDDGKCIFKEVAKWIQENEVNVLPEDLKR